MNGFKILEFPCFGDKTGSLVPLEANINIPFDIKRVYYVYGTQNSAIRGKHAHRKLKQIIFCPSGSCDFILDDGKHRNTVHLNSPTKGLYIHSRVWREFTNFSPNCVVMVLASEHYEPEDYIRNYEDFIKEIENDPSSF